MRTGKSFRGKKILGSLILLAGILWLFFSVIELVREHGIRYFLPSSWQWFVASLLLLGFSMLPAALIFWKLIASGCESSLPWSFGVRLHLLGQVARYLPGRFWGVLYQINSAKGRIDPAVVARANVDLMLLALFGNTFAATLILAAAGTVPWWLAALPVVAGGILRLAPVSGLLFSMCDKTGAASFVPQRVARFFRAMAAVDYGNGLMVGAILVFLGSWVLYVLAWKALFLSYLPLQDQDYLVLCAWYSLAWLVGFVTALTPAGLGVREASFLFFSHHAVPYETVLYVAVIVRLWSLLTEGILVAMAMLLTDTDTEKP